MNKYRDYSGIEILIDRNDAGVHQISQSTQSSFFPN